MDSNPPASFSASDRPVRPRRERKRILSISVVAIFVLGILFAGGFNMALDWTSTEEFCISCHEMKDSVYQEYQERAHYSNRSGVRATCSDCHLPKEFGNKIFHKIKASNDILHKVLGTIDTPEKFEGKRAELAKREWRRLKANDSRECRNCHDVESFDITKQGRRAGVQHEDWLKLDEQARKQQTCIDCHKGIAHQMPHGISQNDPIDQEVNRAASTAQETSQSDNPVAQEPGQADSPNQEGNQTDSPDKTAGVEK